MSLINDYYISYQVRQHHADLLAEAHTNRLARLARQARRAHAKLQRRLLGAQEPAPVEPAPVPAAEVTDDHTEEPAEADREPVGAGRVNSI